jgi:hypothetical protein
MSETRLGIIYLEFGRPNSGVWMAMEFRHGKWTQFQGWITRVFALPQNFSRFPTQKGSETASSYRFEQDTKQTGCERARRRVRATWIQPAVASPVRPPLPLPFLGHFSLFPSHPPPSLHESSSAPSVPSMALPKTLY